MDLTHKYFYCSERAIIRISGKDRATFLQGLCTNDIRAITDPHFSCGLTLSTKGKIYTEFLIATDSENLDLLIDTSQGEKLVRYLEFYAIIEDVKIELLTEKKALCLVFGLEKNQLNDSLKKILLYLSEKNCLHVFSSFADELKEFLHGQKFEQLTQKKYADVRPIFSLGEWNSDYDEQYSPHEASVEHLVSFTKGCFVGQEVVSRMEHKGRSTKILHTYISLEPLQKGDVIVSKTQKVGHITQGSSLKTSKGYYSLGYCKRNRLDHELFCRESPLIPI